MKRNRGGAAKGTCSSSSGLSCHLPTGGPRAASRRAPADRGQGPHAKELDELIAAAVAGAKPAIDDQIVRQLVFDVSRAHRP